MPPPVPIHLDPLTISSISGSISIAFWICVFSPQIIQNFQRRSGDGLSLTFLAIWLAGDVANVIGAIFQHVLPTMLILALYYTLADVILIAQVTYYRALPKSDESPTPSSDGMPSPEHLSPATPLLDEHQRHKHVHAAPPMWKAALWNIAAIAAVCAAGVAGWWMSQNAHGGQPDGGKKHSEEVEWDTWGQVFGWMCAGLYLGSRIPQILHNWRRKTCEGLSLLFFLFSCLGNITYVISIVTAALASQDPRAYIGVNASWIAGSAGTLILDGTIFVQFFMYGAEREIREGGFVPVPNDTAEV
ncbi:PQ-loop-domain-containing protein [Saitoella complicata NRRL Y-17804]|uniref:PQ-loop-domain-containing protein n=1 Tax=Saitoella complicata (strain BCRC 22490 / CBS 7301 / JCM 7358 / NBRC 10748 / NRRL Y-17804) TaxID=698492 RepID=A0A0E9NH24_SAICN|nr:PQ-loop-domain-containing protein [Saitoella complicata NRRL Y-17804]ODQ54116.1 PQ-loop-domain-containing protein [Saitoella complicata NRRL Y-17804]GAO49187.1 hypothetical protein G7K_3345-t1 [Saitoella complicata NRRL Y-17804]